MDSVKNTASPAEAHARLDSPGALLIDVREPEEVAAERVPGAVNIPLGDLPERVSDAQGFESVFVLWRSGARSAIGANILRSAGIRQAMNVEGGITAWRAAGLPTVGG